MKKSDGPKFHYQLLRVKDPDELEAVMNKTDQSGFTLRSVWRSPAVNG